MPNLQQIAALTDQHFQALEVVGELEKLWGCAVGADEVHGRVTETPGDARRLLAQLDAAGYLEWNARDQSAWTLSGLPIAGEVD